MNRITLLVLLFLTLVLASCSKPTIEADLIVTNAMIWTGAGGSDAQAMAISGDTILAIGSVEEVLAFQGRQTEVLDADGKMITPGFIDTHVHLVDGGANLSSVHLRDAKTPEEFSQRIADFAKTVPDGTWITGGEWDGSEWESWPSKDWIDELTPNHPVFVGRLDGHMALANSLAMQLAGVDKNVKDVEGGIILRDKTGELTGIFKDNAVPLISSKIPRPSDEEVDKSIQAAMNYFASNGVTSVHNVWYPSDSEGHMEGLMRAHERGTMITRVFSLGSLAEWSERAAMIKSNGAGDKWLKIDGLKGMLDGALGSHTAAMYDPFSDTPGDKGLLMMSESNLYEWASNADKAGLQLAIHAIGDRAINVLLNTYERIASENGERDRRFRIEHVQHLSPDDVNRFAELGVIASMQPYHAIDDGRWAERVVGPERIKTTYAFKSLFDANAMVAFGSDWSVAPASPILGIYAAVTRRTIDDANPEGWIPEQKISVEQALKGYTYNAAYASFDEKVKGTLEVGKLADFVVLDGDLRKVAPENIKDVKVLQTFVGGKSVYRAP